MATDSARFPHTVRAPRWRQRRWFRFGDFSGSVRVRIYLTLILVILVTLAIAGVVFFFLLGGYQDRLAASTLRQIGVPVYTSVVAPPGTDFQAFEVSRQLAGTVTADPDVRILFVSADGTVLSEASRTPRFRGEQLAIDLTSTTTSDGFLEGTLRTRDNTALDYLAARLSSEAAARFSADFLVLALPSENRQAVLGDLTPRLLLSGGAGPHGGHCGGLVALPVHLPAISGHHRGGPQCRARPL